MSCQGVVRNRDYRRKVGRPCFLTPPPPQHESTFFLEKWEVKLISPLPQGGRRISSSAFLSRRPFGYYLPIASYGTIFAAKWSSNGGLEAVVSK